MLKIIRCEILSLILHNIYPISTSKVVENAKKINSKLPRKLIKCKKYLNHTYFIQNTHIKMLEIQ